MEQKTVGVLFYGSPEPDHRTRLLNPLRGNYRVVPYYAGGDKNELGELAGLLSGVDIIVASDTEAALAALNGTDRHIVVVIAGDPIKSGLNETPLQPGGRVTGHAFDKGVIPLKDRTWETDSGEQRLCLLDALGIKDSDGEPFTRVRVIYNQDENAAKVAFDKIDDAGNKRPRKINVRSASFRGANPDFEQACQQTADAHAIIQVNEPVGDRQDQILDCTRAQPTLYEAEWYVRRPDGGLAAYVPDVDNGFSGLLSCAVTLVDQILGHPAAPLPPMTVIPRKMIVNTATAAMLGIDPPANGATICGGVRVEYYP